MSALNSIIDTPFNDLAEVAGRVVTRNDPEYDEIRAVFYGDVDKHPSAIVRVANVGDVQRVIAMARDENLELAVRSGGHSPVGHGTTDGGVVIDLREMSSIDVDVERRAAWIGTGATALQVTEALSKHGLAIGFGDAGSVGVGGITLGGGIGFLVRKFGMTIDSVLAAEVVTADGEFRLVDSRREPDLFWAIRGGGGNFGVVTRFQFRLNPLPHFTGGLLILPATSETVVAFTTLALGAPDELSTIANVMVAPPMPFLPAEARGRLVILASMAFAGDDDAATQAIAPFRALATPLADVVKPARYVTMYPPEAPSQRPIMNTRTMFVESMDYEAAGTLCEYLSRSHATMRAVQLRPLGGAMSRVPAGATAFAHRSKPILVNVTAFSNGESDRRAERTWVSELATAIRQEDDGAYVNFLGDDGPARIRSAFPDGTWDRLVRIKSKYDPTNLFRLNQNIAPGHSMTDDECLQGHIRR
jgi:FAD/FMN-containing dehydrogenase